ncbi:K(+)-transporting ATPase subunit C [Sinomonas sp. JGH33]|uniref:Potassium-transporting ATPase KdpC subunit n=1 Tax=Sinomonas terricola TaxID=3110330 RepID=A0ABU5T798_9MICC|nr:K(+)-transporting ATPase subunit C [Sinomonas sp. JGH33]MEA5455397.1 K(+)-transporting ATPase subunit C [Sinomonas sp. JGH33]
MNAYLRQLGTSFRFLAVATPLLGVLYPLVMFGVGQAVASAQANGSIAQLNGQPAASTLIVQAVPDKETRFFFPRPSAVKWDPTMSGASNLGPSDPALAKAEADARTAVAAREGVPESAVPQDAVTASASGLDPDISPAYAQLQVPRVAKATGLSVAEVEKLVADSTNTPAMSLLGQPAVNTTKLNLAVATRLK